MNTQILNAMLRADRNEAERTIADHSEMMAFDVPIRDVVMERIDSCIAAGEDVDPIEAHHV